MAKAVRRVDSGPEKKQYTAIAREGKRRFRIGVGFRTGYGREETAVTTRRARADAVAKSRGYVLFLTVISIATVFMCVRFLQLKSTIATQVRQNAAYENELRQIREENAALYADIKTSVDLATLKDRAMNEYGMKYAAPEQIVWYNTVNSGYARQYRDVTADKQP